MVEVMNMAPNDKQYVSTKSPDDWLGCDQDVETPVYLLVQPSAVTLYRDAQWCIAWPVSGVTDKPAAWRHLQVNPCMTLVDQDEPPRYEYRGPMTKSPGPSYAVQIKLVDTTLGVREKIQRLAQDIGSFACEGNAGAGAYASREWVKKLLDSMVASGLMPSFERDRAIQQASAFDV